MINPFQVPALNTLKCSTVGPVSALNSFVGCSKRLLPSIIHCSFHGHISTMRVLTYFLKLHFTRERIKPSESLCSNGNAIIDSRVRKMPHLCSGGGQGGSRVISRFSRTNGIFASKTDHFYLRRHGLRGNL